MPTSNCPLCSGTSLKAFHRDRTRDYLRCQDCWLVFVPTEQHLTLSAEKAVYDLHQNDIDDPGYRRFLSRLAEPLLQQLNPSSLGLDYGCGPGPLLAKMLQQHGHRVDVYDPIYASDQGFRQRRYDFISCTEVVEHFRQPAEEFATLFGLLHNQGILALMTKLVIDVEAFAKWHYKNDPTHISYFSPATLQWLAEHYRRQLSIIGRDVILFLPLE